MRKISLEIEKAGYSGEFYLKDTLNTVIYNEKVSYYYNTNPNKDFSAKIVSGQNLTDGIQVNVKKILQWF